MLIKVASVKTSYVDGPGLRAVVYLQGCPIRCPGCQNKALQDTAGGAWYESELLADKLAFLAGAGRAVTISGGEPFAQTRSLAYLVRALRNRGITDIIIYSGYTWEQLVNRINGSWILVVEILARVSVLVDGPFQAELDHDRINYRGSSNQRVIDTRASLLAGTDQPPVLLDWDRPEMVVTPDGDLVMPIGLAEEFKFIGTVAPSRRCGQAIGEVAA